MKEKSEHLVIEYIIEKPHPTNDFRWCYDVYAANVQGQPSLASGQARDATDAQAKAMNARLRMERFYNG